jgi:hypothetical protein
MTKDNKKIKGTKKSKIETTSVTPPSAIPLGSPFEQLSKEDQENLSKFLNSLNLLGITPKEPETIDEIIADNNTKRDVNTLAPMIVEFLKSFILIGYTMKGERVLITYATNQQQRDALLEQLRLVFINFMNSNNPE